MKTASKTIGVLYVEDDELTRQSVSNRLARNGFKVLAAGSGESALALVENHPDLAVALVDVQLPGIDGIETSLRLRDRYPGLPVVVCSGYLEPPTLVRLRALGIPDECQLRKPCPFRDLLAVLVKVAVQRD